MASTTIPKYVLDRIRRNPPANCHVLRHSTPVLAFGDLFSSTAATLGLNPSSLEFVDKSGRLLDGDERRLATLRSLQLSQLTDATQKHAAKVVEECASYFERKPYTSWFNQLEPMLKSVGASYYNRTGCHLDLIQWATDPKWASLPSKVRTRLLVEDASFLAEQLKSEGIRFLLLNGQAVVRYFKKAFETHLEELEPLCEDGHQQTRIYTGIAFERVQIIGWSTNLQSSFGVTKPRRLALAAKIKQIASASGSKK